jgi:hypothetical protein
MLIHEKRPDRERAPPRISWRRLLNADAPGLAMIGLFLGTLLILAAFILFATRYVQA